MRCVIYDADDMEPITVFDVPNRFLREIDRGERGPDLAFAPVMPMDIEPYLPDDPGPSMARYCRLHFERIIKDGRTLMWLCTTRDGETALQLKAAFLPGQVAEVQNRVRGAFLRGLMVAFGE